MPLFANPQQYGQRGLPLFELVISANADHWSLAAALAAAGYTGGAAEVTITVDAGVRVGSTNPATPGMTLEAMPAGSVIALTNNGTINGAGGPGGASNGAAGQIGGTGIKASYPFDLTNNGTIYGGGGGGQAGSQGSAYNGDCFNSFKPGGAGGAGGTGEGNAAATVGSAGGGQTGNVYQSNEGSCDQTSSTWSTVGGTGSAGGGKGATGGGNGGLGGYWIDGHSFATILVAGTVFGRTTG